MSQEKNLQELRENIPEACKQEIFKIGEQSTHFSCVYRVAKTGKIEERTFISTFDEIEEGYIPDNEARYPKDDVGTYSTSVYTDRKMCDKFINMLKKSVRLRETYPHPEVLMGKTSNGIVQRTVDRKPEYEDDTHVDWWIFRGKVSTVMGDFCIAQR